MPHPDLQSPEAGSNHKQITKICSINLQETAMANTPYPFDKLPKNIQHVVRLITAVLKRICQRR